MQFQDILWFIFTDLCHLPLRRCQKTSTTLINIINRKVRDPRFGGVFCDEHANDDHDDHNDHDDGGGDDEDNKENDDDTFGDDTGESAPRFAKLVKLRREANGDLGIIVIMIIVMKVRKTEI